MVLSRHLALGLFAALNFLGPPLHAADKCHLGKVAELPITMSGLRPLVTVQINGKDARFALDSGSFYSMMTAPRAAEFGLKLTPAPNGLRVMGIGGTIETSIATVKEFNFAGARIHNVEFLVGGSEIGAAGLLGQNFLEKWDDEYDFAKGAVRLFQSDGCKKARMAYWLTPGQDYSVMDIDRTGPGHLETIGDAYVNGTRIRVKFDTGAYGSVLTLKAAARAGIKPDSPGVVAAGYERGIGRGMVKLYIAPFSSFKIGDGEEIKNSRLRIADIDLWGSDMLLGADFFISHHVFVANSQQKLYLTYNGGAVFSLGKAATSQTTANDSKTDAPPMDAAALARSGSALAARRDFEHGLADLSKAVELAPAEPEYLFERAMVYWQNGQSDKALADLDKVLALKDDFLPAYIPRAQLRLHDKNVADAMADLEAVDRLAPKQSDLRLELGDLYESNERFPLAIAQFDLWISNHSEDSRMPQALGSRCLSSALQNQDLSGGISACNRAMWRADKSNPVYPQLYADRGLIRVRQGEYDKAIADFDTALKLAPKLARALYGRGVAEARKNKATQSAADIASAKTIAPQLAERYQRYGIIP
jgi:tetratricopeptide (TPR) repeat protein/predicted aspartyl protease